MRLRMEDTTFSITGGISLLRIGALLDIAFAYLDY